MSNSYKKLPREITWYINRSHLGGLYDIKELIDDAEDFSYEGLKAVALDKSIDFKVRKTALWMIGVSWTEKALDDIYELILKDHSLTQNIEVLLGNYELEYSKKIADKLFDKGIISAETKLIAHSDVDMRNRRNMKAASIGVPKYKKDYE